MFNDRLVRQKWGYYITLLDRKHFKVKLLRFHAKEACSYQYHHKRSELWCFLSGYGRFQLNDEVFGTHPDSVLHIGTRDKHEYMAITPSLVLEIQYGERCDEGDIVRV